MTVVVKVLGKSNLVLTQKGTAFLPDLEFSGPCDHVPSLGMLTSYIAVLDINMQ